MTHNGMFAPFKRGVDALHVVDATLQPGQDVLPQHRTLVHFQPSHFYGRCGPTEGRSWDRGWRAVRISRVDHLHKLRDAIRMRGAPAQREVFQEWAHNSRHILFRGAEHGKERIEGRTTDLQHTQMIEIVQKSPRSDQPSVEWWSIRTVCDGERVDGRMARSPNQVRDAVVDRITCVDVQREAAEAGGDE